MFPMSNQKKFIFLRGLTRESRHWGDFTNQFLTQFPEAQIFFLDLPGSGKMHKEICPLSVESMVEILRKQLPQDSLGKGDLLFIGMSLGGMVALEWSKKYPEDLSSTIIINSSASKLLPFWYRLRPSAYPYILLAGILKSKQHEMIFRKVCQNKTHQTKTIKLWKEIHETSPVSLSNAIRQIFSASRFKLDKDLKVRGMVITSYGDELVSHKCSMKLASELGWPIKIHSWGGHELSDDDPDWVITEIKSFIG
jgi:pimeloyl-ACP methyl ester carboxylesterase